MLDNNFNPNEDTIANLPLYRLPADILESIIKAINFNNEYNIANNDDEVIKARIMRAFNEPYAMTKDLTIENKTETTLNQNNDKIINGDTAFSKFLENLKKKNKNNDSEPIINLIINTYKTMLKDAIHGE